MTKMKKKKNKQKSKKKGKFFTIFEKDTFI